jgi:hypothetical protein
MMNGLLFDSTEDLQDAVRKEQKIKELKENKAKSNIRDKELGNEKA